MKKFRNLKTGLVEVVYNEEVIRQCERHTEAWEEVKEKTSRKEKTTEQETEKSE